jgi:hypothetical protein
MLRDEYDVIFQPNALTNFGLEPGLSEVEAEGFNYLLLVVLDTIERVLGSARLRPEESGETHAQ